MLSYNWALYFRELGQAQSQKNKNVFNPKNNGLVNCLIQKAFKVRELYQKY